MTVEQKIRNFILASFLFTDDPSALRNDDSFMKRGIIDSTGILEVIHFLGEAFGVTVSDAEMIPENLDSVDRLVAFAQHKMSRS
jgi:acyl carrier protein